MGHHQVWPTSGRLRPNLPRSRPMSAALARNRPILVKSGPSAANVLVFGPLRPDVPRPVQIWAKVRPNLANLGRTSADSGGRHRPSSATFEQLSTDLGQIRPLLAELGPTPTKCWPMFVRLGQRFGDFLRLLVGHRRVLHRYCAGRMLVLHWHCWCYTGGVWLRLSSTSVILWLCATQVMCLASTCITTRLVLR